jgi:phage gp29-like protein
MALFDAYGREVDIGRLQEEQAAPTMAGVRNIYSVMHPSVGLTPERLTGILRQAEFGDPFLYLELAEEMEEKDLHYLAVLGTRKESAAQLDLVVRPASSSAADVRIADMVSESLLNGALNLTGSIFDIQDALGKGFSATEIVWDTSGREWAPVRLIWRDPRWFLFDWISGEQLLVRSLENEGPEIPLTPPGGYTHVEPRLARRQQASGGSALWNGLQPLTAPLAPFKFITHFGQAKSGLPIRGGLARAAGWSYLFKNYVLKDWVMFAEVFGQPLRVGKYHPGATESDRQALLRAVANIGTDAAAIIPESMIIEFTQARTSASTDLYERFCQYADNQVSKAVLGQTLTTEVPRGSGSRAAAQVHEAVRRDILSADARRLEETLRRDLVKPLVDLNAGPQKQYPRLQLALPDAQDTKIFADMVAELADRGLRIGQKTILDRLGLPEAPEGEPVLSPARSGIGAITTANHR